MKYDALLQQVAKSRCVLVYGLSDATKAFLQAVPKLPVAGLLDGFQTAGELYGHQIVALEEAPRLGVDAIVIVARAASVRIIARRIEGYCREHGIHVYDVVGQDLLVRKAEAIANHPYFAVSMEDLRRAIDTHEVISFDIFDTLLQRRVPEPEDVFDLLEVQCGIRGFAQARKKAEHALYRNGGNPTIVEIYEALAEAMGWSTEEASEIREAELALERRLLVPRREMTEAVTYAKAQGKTVCLVSDMYLPSSWLAKTLAGCGITGQDAIFVSCEYGRFKTQGLFEDVRKTFPAASYLHVGDNEDADGTAARVHGFDAFHVASAAELAELSSWGSVLGQAEALPEKLLAGAILEQLFCDPFALTGSAGRPLLQTGRELGFAIFGPVVVAFFYWVLRQTRGQQDVVLWGARDGYLFAKMHEALRSALPEAARSGLPRGVYFYTSRMAALPTALHAAEDVLALAHIGFAGTPEQLLAKRFGLSEGERLVRTPGESLDAYVLRHVPQILQHGEELRRCAEKYIQKLGLQGQHMAFVDLVSSGSCHMAAEDLLGQRVLGCYLVHIEDASPRKAALLCRAYLEEGALLNLHTVIAQNYEPLETVAMSEEPSLARFDADGHPVFSEEVRTAEDLAYLREVQAGVMELFAATLPQAKIFLQEDVRPEFVDAIYGCLQRGQTRIPACPLADTDVPDDFTNRTFQMKDMFD